MGKRRKKDIDTAEVLPELKTEFIDLPQRPYRVITIDLTDPNEPYEQSFDLEEIKGAVIKVVARYRAGDEEYAGRILDEVMKTIRPLAHFVRPPEKQVVHSHTKRIEQITQDQHPMEAFEHWIRRKPPPRGIEESAVRNLMEDLVANVEWPKERAVPHSTAIRALVYKNWMPFKGTFEVAPIPDGLIGVFAKYEGQEARSNRGGKSAFLEGILFANFGHGRDLQGEEMNIHEGEDQASVGVAWEVNDEPFLVTRDLEFSGRGGARSAINISGTQRRISEGNDMIVDALGMNRDDFHQTCFARQGDLQSILRRRSNELKADIIRWRNLKVWDSLEAVARSRLDSIRLDHKVITDALEVDREIVEEGRPEDAEINRLKKMIREAEKFEAKKDNAEERIKELNNYITWAERLAECKELIKEKERYESDLKAEEKEVTKSQNAYTECRDKYLTAKRLYEEQREIAEGEFDGVCPIDKEQCPRVDEINEDCQGAAERLEELQDERDEAKKIMHDAESEIGIKIEVRDGTKEALRKIEDAEDFIEKNDDLKSVEEYEKERSKLENSATNEEWEGDNPEALRDQLADLMTLVTRFNESVEAIEKREGKVEELESKMKTYRYVRLLCGKRGIPSMMIEDALVDIEAAVNNILEDLGCDHRLEFSYERELKHLAKACFECGESFPETATVKYCKQCGAKRQRDRTDDLTPMIREGDRVQTYDQDSGAGRSLVALAVRVAMSQFLGAKILFLDEVCSDLDEYHLPIMIRLLHKLPSMGFKQVFVISHQRALAEALPRGIWVTRFQGESRSEVKIGPDVYVSVDD